ncbi:MAG: copper transporter [Nocardioidaceae bacterium]
MISFRYHIVSIVSVFLALAIGVALGGGPLKGEVDNSLVDQVKSDRATKTRLQTQISGLRSGNTFLDDFAGTVAPGVLANTLRGRVVTLVVLPTALQADVAGLKALVVTAGGTVGGTLRVGNQLVDVGNKQLVDELGSQLEGRAPALSIPADAGPYERIGTLIGRAIGTLKKSGARVDGTASTILAALDAASLMSTDGTLRRRGDLVLFVTGAGHGTAAAQKGAGTIITALARSVDAVTAGAVLAGPPASARGDGQVKALRDDVGAAKDVSTVDTLGRTAGQVVTVMALAGQAAGRTGQYGAVDAADGAMPGASGATD